MWKLGDLSENSTIERKWKQSLDTKENQRMEEKVNDKMEGVKLDYLPLTKLEN